ncbi:MAG: hypothetical protein Fur0012_11380 [Elusimicrobiota bacterium]
MKFLHILAIVSMLSFTSAYAADKERDENIILPDTNLIDVPTSGIIDYYGFSFKSRFYSSGGVLTWLNFGVMERLNLGASFMVDNLVGSGTPVKMVHPEIQVKFRFYDGGIYLPSLAVGYDGQGYYYDRDLKKYMEKEKGLYLAASKEIGAPGLVAHAGLNIPDFDNNYLFSFLGLNYTIEDKVSLMAEYDNLFHSDDPERLNFGARFYITPSFSLDAAVRELGKSEKFSNGWPRKSERVIQLKYNTSF